MSKAVFERNEKKYLLNTREKEQLLDSIRDYLVPDRYAKYTICNLYLDTPDFFLVRESLEKPLYKEKLRLRSYGVPDEKSPAFLEIKKKFSGTVGKRRIELPLGILEQYLKTGELPKVTTQIFREIDYTIRRYAASPKVYLAYDREAYTGKEDNALRITFDTNIRYRLTRLDLKAGDDGTALMPEDFVILEIKTLGAIPLWLSKALCAHEIYPGSFSKYGSVYQKLHAEVLNHV